MPKPSKKRKAYDREVTTMGSSPANAFEHEEKKQRTDKPIPADVYPVIDTDLARDNLENDLPAADREDL